MRKYALVLVIAAVSVQAQEFVSSVEFVSGHTDTSKIVVGPATATATFSNLYSVIRWAYGLQPEQVGGGPEWLTSTMFDIRVKSPTSVSESKLRVMMQKVLTDRFGLEAKWTNKPTKVDVLRVPAEARRKNFAPSKELNTQKPDMQITPKFLVLSGLWKGMEISWLVTECSFGDIPTVDGSGMPGRWDFNFTLKDERPPVGGFSSQEERSMWLASYAQHVKKDLTDQLGVTFTREPAYPVKTLVITHVNRIPTPN